MSRDRILEQALEHELRAADTAVTDACLDAETLGAWADEGLDAAAMAAVEAHVSNCARCQALVAAFTHGNVLSTSAPGIVTTPSPPGTLSRLKWWLAPIAAAAAAVTIWMVVPEQREAAFAPPPVTAESDRAPAAAQAADPSPPTSAPQLPARERQPPNDTLAAGAREDRRQLRDEAKQEKANTLAEAVVTPKEIGAAAAPAPPTPSAPAAPQQASDAAVALQKSARASLAPIEVISPNRALRWRVAGGAIERSEDAGASWAPVRATGGETITAGTSPAGSICWLIGANGLVLISVDGITFAHVPLPEAVDLTSIIAADARNATVTSADGRRFRTDDSGRTWRAF